MKNCKTFYEGQAANWVKEIIQPFKHHSPNQIKSYYVSETKFFYGDIPKYTDICF